MPVTSLLERFRQVALDALGGEMRADDELEMDLFMSTVDVDGERREIVTVALRVPLAFVSDDAPRSMSSRVSILTTVLDSVFAIAVVEAWHGVRDFRDFNNQALRDMSAVDDELTHLIDGS